MLRTSITTKYSDHISLFRCNKKITIQESKIKIRKNLIFLILSTDKIKEKEYKELYSHSSHDLGDPLLGQ